MNACRYACRSTDHVVSRRSFLGASALGTAGLLGFGGIAAEVARIALGSGFIIDPSGLIVTNNHVVGEASKVEVTIEAGPELVLLVRDNGTGIKETGRRSGLANLADRAALLGGTMRAGPAEGGGTELEWRVPLPES